jgi:transcriptional regulator with XRE-family HTH domain
MFNLEACGQSDSRTSYSEATMWEPFLADIDSASFHVLIHVPFIALNRMQFFWHRFEQLRARGVAICIFLREPELWEGRNAQVDQGFDALVNKLREIGVHVTPRKLIHEKLAVIDGRVLWDGSLNYLSHRNTKERANRFASRAVVREAMKLHDMNSCDQCRDNRNLSCSQSTAEALLTGLSLHRRLAGVSQRDFAKSRKTSQSWISRVESGKHESVSVSTLCEYSSALGVRPVLIPDELMPAVAQMLETYINTTPSGTRLQKPQALVPQTDSKPTSLTRRKKRKLGG